MHFFYLSLSLFSLVLSGFFGLLIALTKAPAFYLLKSPQLFYHFLVGHVTFSITVWLMTFTLAYWQYKEGRRGKVPPLTTLMGMFFLSLSCLLPYGEPYLNNYIPVINNPVFFSGLTLFFLGFLWEALLRANTLRDITSSQNIRQLYSISIILGFLTILSLLPSLLTAHAEGGVKLYFERLFWVSGHIQQFLYASLMLAVWHELSGKRLSSSLLTASNLLLFTFSLIMLVGFFRDVLSYEMRFLSAVSFGVGIGVPVLVHTYCVLRHLSLNMSVATLSLVSSISVYYAGELVAYGGMQSDLRIPAHYHGVVSAVSIAFMGFAYYMLKERLGRVDWERIAKLQPLVLALGINLIVLGFYIAGSLGAPRKTYGFEYAREEKILSALNLLGIGGFLTAVGGLFFVLYTIKSLIKIYKHDSAR
ncbi:cbb3-type cytochrome c oxidase subunit I [Hydrogenobacter hydrogenophilus]|uniref:Heme/copper-type cytochrome/quinol oxidase, subunit 1 n=1 Tax=Hydrogenobacter hydrogenophilus TaxID=35835 RepID=A0A285P4N3_9AQUI|nr:cbb3-type cytochrome c oxidase subunit I [Hydrogenobacter hydrogenophilus]SNZ16684.1 Heme/copper-type cytochrome/quinol oxidase, subunit 1 [Hydrogenobacter hydrogenophilus]